MHHHRCLEWYWYVGCCIHVLNLTAYFRGASKRPPCTLSNQVFRGGHPVFQGGQAPSGPLVIRPLHLRLLTCLCFVSVTNNSIILTERAAKSSELLLKECANETSGLGIAASLKRRMKTVDHSVQLTANAHNSNLRGTWLLTYLVLTLIY